MKTMNELCKRFGRLHPGYDAYLDKLQSYKGYYRVYIYNQERDLGSWYTFATGREFKEWTDGVILE